MNWSTIIGIVLVLYAGFVVYRGRISTSDDYHRSSYISRADKPVQFWFSVFVVLIMAALLLLGVFRF